MTLLDSAEAPTSYALVSIGAGNRLFSLRNNQLNAKQSTTATLVYSPALGYYHKSGLSLAVGASLLNDAEKGFGVNQFSISPAYNVVGNDHIDAGLSYTHYLVKDKFSTYSSPVQHDLYGTFAYKKPWVQPGLALGYSTGEYKQVRSKDTVINNIRRYFYDSITNHLEVFSVILNASHRFTFQQLFTKNDGLQITTSMMLNMGSSNTIINRKTNAPNLLAFLNRRGRVKRELTSSFRAESIGFSADALYAIGNFSFSPQVYLDYYLPESDEKRFTQVFTLTASYSF